MSTLILNLAHKTYFVYLFLLCNINNHIRLCVKRFVDSGFVLASNELFNKLFNIFFSGPDGKVFSLGSGSIFAYGVLDKGYRNDLTDPEAYNLGQRATYHATFRGVICNQSSQ